QQGAQGGQGGMGAPNQPGQPGADQPGGAQGGADQPGAMPNTPGGGLGNPIDTPDPLQKYKWYIFSALGLVLVIAAGFMLRAKPGQEPALAGPAAPSPLAPTLPPGVKATTVRAGLIAHPANGAAQKPASGLSGTLAALKEELFQLETERLEGKITDAEYAEHKAALETLLKRALARESASR
ncbi:MAG: hypothetical protein WBD46_18155, partial [Acidobacteriaceae bacterium]